MKARRGLLFALVLGLAGGAAGQGVRERAFAWAQGDFRAPLTCLVDGTPREALRRVRIHPGPRHSARPALRLTFFDLDAPPDTRCTSFSGQAEPNVIGTLELVWDGRTRPDTGEVDFRNALRREGGFDFKIEAGRLRIGAVEAGRAGERVVDFAGGVARASQVPRGSDTARRLAAFGGQRHLALEVTAPDGARLSFDLVELDPPPRAFRRRRDVPIPPDMSQERPEPALRSTREGEPDAELQIDTFVMQLGETVDALQDAEASGLLVKLRGLASPLVERCSQLGYDALADAARQISEACLERNPVAAHKAVVDFTELSKRVRRGHRSAAS